ncbi:MAG TPA: hypothetical protein VMH39_02290, partial [Gemmatimonadaceae bacterium]|nr:hypothetical protein [Gemmatimonadaceae bacterium]
MLQIMMDPVAPSAPPVPPVPPVPVQRGPMEPGPLYRHDLTEQQTEDVVLFLRAESMRPRFERMLLDEGGAPDGSPSLQTAHMRCREEWVRWFGARLLQGVGGARPIPDGSLAEDRHRVKHFVANMREVLRERGRARAETLMGAPAMADAAWALDAIARRAHGITVRVSVTKGRVRLAWGRPSARDLYVAKVADVCRLVERELATDNMHRLQARAAAWAFGRVSQRSGDGSELVSLKWRELEWVSLDVEWRRFRRRTSPLMFGGMGGLADEDAAEEVPSVWDSV